MADPGLRCGAMGALAPMAMTSMGSSGRVGLLDRRQFGLQAVAQGLACNACQTQRSLKTTHFTISHANGVDHGLGIVGKTVDGVLDAVDGQRGGGVGGGGCVSHGASW